MNPPVGCWVVAYNMHTRVRPIERCRRHRETHTHYRHWTIRFPSPLAERGLAAAQLVPPIVSVA